MKKLLFFVAAAVAGVSVFASEVYVATDGVDAEGRGGSDAPFASIAYAVSSLGASGGTVWVGRGTYPISAPIQLTNPIAIKGIEGDYGAVVVSNTVQTGDASYLFYINNANASVSWLSAVKGYVGNGRTRAAGITIGNAGGTVSHCRIADCTGNNNYSSAGAFLLEGGLVSECVIESCKLNNSLTDYYSGQKAVGALLHGSSKMEKCFFRGFAATSYGHVVALHSSSAVLSECTIVDSGVNSFLNDTKLSYGVYCSAGRVSGCAIIGVRRGGSGAGGVVSVPGPAPWGGTADCFENCATDGEEPINDACFAVLTDCAFRDYTAKDYTPAPGGILAVHGIGCYAYSEAGFDAAFGVDRYAGPTGGEFLFTATSAGATGPVSYQWDFDGDGSYDTEPSASASISHAYDALGTFSPVLKASDGSTVLEISRANLVTVAPAVVYVDATSASPVSPYADPTHAAKTITDAVAVANDGTEIRVAPGLYKVTGPFTLSHGIRVIGTAGDPGQTVVSNTTLNSVRNLAVLNHPDAFVGNLSFQKGFVTTSPNSAAGVTIETNGGTVSNCVITACKSDNNQSQVGGAYVKGGLLTHSIVENCYQDNGQHMGSGQRKAGGALVTGWGKVSNTLFRKMPNGGYGHVVWVASSVAVVENCTVVDSILSSEDNGAKICYGIYIENGTVRNCAMFGISRVAVGSTPATDYAAWGGKADNFIACATDGEAKINDTCFLSTKEAAFSNYGTGDLTPSPGQGGVLFDQGAEVASAPATDLAGKDRVSGDAIDIGAYEFQSAGLVVDFSASLMKGTAPVDVTFVATVIGASGTVTYDWDFDGDGVYEVEGLTSPAIVQAYAKAGVYDVGLRVHDTGSATPFDVRKSNYLTLAPAVIFVDVTSAEPQLPYDDPDHAATSIADAVAQGLAGSTVRVAPGTYEISSPIRLTDGIRVVGASGNPADTIVKNTVRDGGLRSLAILDHVDAGLANLTLTNGYANCQPYYAAGVTIEEKGGTVSNCVIVGCTGTINQDSVGGAYVKAGLLTHCVIDDCRVPNHQIMVNSYKCGGALVLGSGRVENTLFRNFKSSSYGHILWVDGTYASAVNCTIADSIVSYYMQPTGETKYPASGVYCTAGSIVNCAAFGISRAAFDTTPATEFAAWGGTAAKFDHCATDGEAAINDSCYLMDKLVDVKDYAKGDFSPKTGGALTNRGVLPDNVPATDLAGRPRVVGKAIDIGCYEGNAAGLMLLIR